MELIRRAFRKFLARCDVLEIYDHQHRTFMYRYKLLRTRFGNLYLHEIVRSDSDLCLHDHPWRFVTLILAGGYWEELAGGHWRWRSPGTLLYRPAKFAHRIEVDRPAWSLVWVTPKVKPWGFFQRDGWKPWNYGDPRPICGE